MRSKGTSVGAGTSGLSASRGRRAGGRNSSNSLSAQLQRSLTSHIQSYQRSLPANSEDAWDGDAILKYIMQKDAGLKRKGDTVVVPQLEIGQLDRLSSEAVGTGL